MLIKPSSLFRSQDTETKTESGFALCWETTTVITGAVTLYQPLSSRPPFPFTLGKMWSVRKSKMIKKQEEKIEEATWFQLGLAYGLKFRQCYFNWVKLIRILLYCFVSTCWKIREIKTNISDFKAITLKKFWGNIFNLWF